MKFLFEIFPIALFFAVFKFKGIYAATAAAIVAALLQVAFSWWRHRRVESVVLISMAVLLVFGGTTLLLHNESFIKWKPSILYWLFAAIIAAARLAYRKNIIQMLMGKQISLPAPVWEKLNVSWAGFFALLGAVNLFVAYRYSTAAWVNFKLFGLMGFMLVFALAQGLLLAPYMNEGKDGNRRADTLPPQN